MRTLGWILAALFLSVVPLDAQGPEEGVRQTEWRSKGQAHVKQRLTPSPPQPPGESRWLLTLEASIPGVIFDTPEGPAFGFSTNANITTNKLREIQDHHLGLRVGQTLIVTVQLDTVSNPVFNLAQGPEPTCKTPPSARLYIEDRGWSGTGNNYLRWWSRDGYFRFDLDPMPTTATWTLAIPLDPHRWSGVNGWLADTNSETLAFFHSVLAGWSDWGLTFGGGCSYGHGLYVSGGTASLTILDYRVE